MKKSILILFLAIIACTPRPLKPLDKTKSYSLSVLLVEDERLYNFSLNEYRYLFEERLPSLVKEYLGYDVSITLKEKINVEEFYNNSLGNVWANSSKFTKKCFNIYKDEKTLIYKSIFKALSRYQIDEIKRYIKSIGGDIHTRDDGALFITEKYISDVKKIYEHKINSKPIYRKNTPVLYTKLFWEIVAKRKDYDIIIVNTPIAGADRSQNLSPYLEASVTAGFVVPNSARKTDATVVLSVYPFLSTDSFFREKRGVIADSEKKEVFAFNALHNFGHLLWRYDNHNYEDISIMSEPKNLDYYNWYLSILEKGVREPYKMLKCFPVY